MMNDPGGFTEVTNQSYFDRMQNACAGVCIGFLLFFGSWGVLFWNEGRAVKRQEDLDEGRGIVQQVGFTTINATIDSLRDGQLVWITGVVDGGDAVIYDDLFKINVTNATGGAIKYERNVQMYQWEERSSTRTEKTSGGGTRKITTYSYEKQWLTSLRSSSSFKEAVTPPNPTSFLVQNAYLTSDDIGLGPFRLSNDITSQIDWETPWYDAPVDLSLVNFTGYTSSFSGGQVSYRKTANMDSIGDTRVNFAIVLPDDISVVARQGTSGILEPYITSGDRELLLFSRGIKTSDELFLQAEEDNNTLTWILRFVGFLAMVIGVCMILNPIATAFDVLPFCGDALEGCIGGCIIPCIALVICVPMSLLIISIAWIFYRPIFAIGSLVMIGLLGFFYVKYLKPKLSKPPAQQTNPSQQPPSQQPQTQNYNENYDKPQTQNYNDSYGQPEATAEPMGYEQQNKYTEPVPQQNNYQAQEQVPFGQALDNPPPASNPGFSPPPSYPEPTNTGGGGYKPP